MTKTTSTASFGGSPSTATNHVEHTTTEEMPADIAASTLASQDNTVRGWKTSIYKFYFPLVAANGETRNAYQCIRHMLAIIGKHCKNQFKVLPKVADDDKNEAIAIWTDFPNSKDAAGAYIFNTRYPQQNFGKRAGAVDFVTELRVSTTHSASWLKQQSTLVTEFKRHKYWLKAREDAPSVPIKPIIWLGGPDPDNCSTANLRALLQSKAPTADFLHLEKHRLTARPDGQKKVFVTHVLKVSAPADTAWSTSRHLLKYLNEVTDDDKPNQLKGVKGVPMSNRDISKPALAAAITEQNKYLDHSAAVQMVNVWKLDSQVNITDALMDALATFDLDEMTESVDLRHFIRNPVAGKTTIRDLLYAMVEGRPDISTNILKDDYIRGRSWNLVCDTDAVQQVSYVADIFLGALNDALSPITVAQICGSNTPTSIDKQPRVEFIKQYDEDGCTTLQPTFGSNLQAFSEQYGVPLEPQQKTTTTDFSRPPRATFVQAHLHKTRVLGTDRASWAAVVYKAAFDTDEPKQTPFRTTKRKPKRRTPPPSTSSTQQSDQQPTAEANSPPTPPTDEPTDAPAQPTPSTAPSQQTAPPSSQYQLKVDAMELAIAQMQESQASLDTTARKLETNVAKISSSVEVIANSQRDLQSKFESIMESTHTAKQQQKEDIKTLLQDAMHEHVYPQLHALLAETSERVEAIEHYLDNESSPTGHTPNSESDNDSDNEPMDTSTTTDMTGRKHHGSPSRTIHTPPSKRASRTLHFSPAATPDRTYVSSTAPQEGFSGFTEQSQLSGGSE